MFMFILNLGYLFRFGCTLSEAERRENNAKDTVQKVEMLQSPRCIESHLPLQLLPEQLWTVKPKAKYPIFTQPNDKWERTIKIDWEWVCEWVSESTLYRSPILGQSSTAHSVTCKKKTATTICRAKITSHTKLNNLYCKIELFYNNIVVFGGIYFENFRKRNICRKCVAYKEIKKSVPKIALNMLLSLYK